MCKDGVSGRIFSIQRFSVHDGPGIRTTVFMKGCPLRCKWCHNPEGLSRELQLQFFEEKCISCGSCGNRSHLSDAQKCPTKALCVCGEELFASQVIEEAVRDKAFYGENGGITFSGGECLLQTDFVTTVLLDIKKMGIHTAIDTCGLVPWHNIEKTLPVCDLYLYDIKCINPILHESYTGADNTLILENLRKLSKTGKEIWARIPVIPGFNNDEKEMRDIAGFISSLSSIKQVTLIPYHTLGAGKYKTLGIPYPYDETLKISDDELEKYKKIMEYEGLTVL